MLANGVAVVNSFVRLFVAGLRLKLMITTSRRRGAKVPKRGATGTVTLWCRVTTAVNAATPKRWTFRLENKSTHTHTSNDRMYIL